MRELGILKITTTPPGARLFLDGKKLDQTSPATLDGIEAGGEHTLLVQADGYADGMERFTLKPREVAALDVKLARDAAPAGPKRPRPKSDFAPVADAPTPKPPAAAPAAKLEGEGTLIVASNPWCNVSVDGAEKGPTPISVKLPAGPHAIVLSNPEFHIQRTLSVTVHDGETVRKKLDFGE